MPAQPPPPGSYAAPQAYGAALPPQMPGAPSAGGLQHAASAVPQPAMAAGASYLTAQNSAIQVGGLRGSALELEISATGLKGKDLLSKSDPVCVVEVMDNGKWKRAGKTEVLKNEKNPHWATRVNLTYVFELFQEVRFVLKDVDSKRPSSDDALGVVIAPLSEIVTSGATQFRIVNDPSRLLAPLKDKDLGTLTVRAREVGGDTAGLARVKVAFSAKKLDRADGPLNKSDPYFQVEQILGAGPAGRSVVYRSEVVKNNLNPKWRPASFVVNTYGRPLHNVELEIRLMDHDDNSSHDALGSVKCSLGALVPLAILDVASPPKRRKKMSKSGTSGVLIVDNVTVTQFPSLIQYTMGGCRLRFVTAVDFTQSNGEPTSPGTLHYSDGYTKSSYGQALQGVGQVVDGYLDESKQFEAFGFGAIPPGAGGVSFDFPLNTLSPTDARVVGVGGLLGAYEQATKAVRVSCIFSRCWLGKCVALAAYGNALN